MDIKEGIRIGLQELILTELSKIREDISVVRHKIAKELVEKW